MPMPTFTLSLDQERQLRYTWSACVRLEHRRGKTMSQIIGDLHWSDMTGVRDLIWAGLLHSEKDLKVEDVETMLDGYMASGGSLIDLYRLWNDAVVASEMFGKAPAAAPTKGGAEGNVDAAAGAQSS